MFDFWDHPHALLSYSKKKSYDCEAVGFHPLARIKFLDEQKMQQFAEMISIREPTISNVIGFMDGLGLATEMTDKRIQQNAYYCGYDCDTMVNSVLVFGPDLGCAFRFLFRFFLPGLIFRNSRYSAKFPDSGGTHVGIKSFQGKINLLRNSGSGIPDLEFRREGPVTSPQYHTVLPFFCNLPTPFNVACGAWSAIAIVSTYSRRTPPTTLIHN